MQYLSHEITMLDLRNEGMTMGDEPWDEEALRCLVYHYHSLVEHQVLTQSEQKKWS